MLSKVDIDDYKTLGTVQPSNSRKGILDEANSIVNGARTEIYGGPEDSFNSIARLWDSYLDRPYGTMTAADVAILLGLMKVARLKMTPTHRDSWVDMAGYAACGAECALKGK